MRSSFLLWGEPGREATGFCPTGDEARAQGEVRREVQGEAQGEVQREAQGEVQGEVQGERRIVTIRVAIGVAMRVTIRGGAFRRRSRGPWRRGCCGFRGRGGGAS